MAERFGNQCSTTVATGGYTAGSGVLNVASTAAPWPTSPTFTVLLGNNAQTLLRVTAVASATQWTVTAEANDASAAAGASVLGTILSAAALTQIESDSGGGAKPHCVWFPQPPGPYISTPFGSAYIGTNFPVGAFSNNLYRIPDLWDGSAITLRAVFLTSDGSVGTVSVSCATLGGDPAACYFTGTPNGWTAAVTGTTGGVAWADVEVGPVPLPLAGLAAGRSVLFSIRRNSDTYPGTLYLVGYELTLNY